MSLESIQLEWVRKLEEKLNYRPSVEAPETSLNTTSRLLVALLLDVLKERQPTAFAALVHGPGEELPSEDFSRIGASYRMLLSLLGLAEGYHQFHGFRSQGMGLSRTLEELKKSGVDASRIQECLGSMDIRLVSTAHPTNIFRSIVLGMRKEVYRLIRKLQDPASSEADFALNIQSLRERLVMMSATRFGRWEKPNVLDEVRQVIGYFRSSTYKAAPAVELKLRSEIERTFYEENESGVPPFKPVLRFGSWVGGDMDGNPFVNSRIYRKAVDMQRSAALELFAQELKEAAPAMSLAYNPEMELDDLVNSIQSDLNSMEMAGLDPDPLTRFVTREPFRLKLELMYLKVDRARSVHLEDHYDEPFVYRSPDEVQSDLDLLSQSLYRNGFASSARKRIQPLQLKMEMFGFHLASLDLREDSLHIARAARLALKAAGYGLNPGGEELYSTPENLQEGASQTGRDPEDSHHSYLSLLTEEVLNPRFINPGRLVLDEESINSLFTDQEQYAPVERIYEMLRSVHEARRFAGERCTTNLILTMTSRPEDALHALLLLKTTGHFYQNMAGTYRSNLDIVPLFETVRDLINSVDIMKALWENEAYKKQLHARQNKQLIMLGFSDSNKDGGYFTSNWSIHDAQRRLLALAQEFGIAVRFFYGRGGSIGRGGASSRHAAHSVPDHAMERGYELTEQGEVLSRYYVNEEIAAMHLETVLGAALEKNAEIKEEPPEEFFQAATELSELCDESYRKLIHNDPRIVQYFEEATPREVELVKIGSRPGRRRQMRAITDLRAIPWVFRWFQSRQLLPGWFAFGSGMQALSQKRNGGEELLRRMYDEWPFFRAIVQNSALAQMHTNLEIAALFRDLSAHPQDAAEVFELIRQEYELCRSWMEKLGCDTEDFYRRNFPVLLSAWKLKEPWVDDLGRLQTSLLKRYRDLHAGAEDHAGDLDYQDQMALLEGAVTSTIEGVAIGLGATG